MKALPELIPVALLAAIATPVHAQSSADAERVEIESNKVYHAVAYGLDLVDAQAMPLALGVSLLADDGTSHLAVTGGQPGASMMIVVGFQEARVPLFTPSAKTWLLIGDPRVLAVGTFDAKGRVQLKVGLGQTKFAGAELHLQAFSISKTEYGYAPVSSNGLELQLHDNGR